MSSIVITAVAAVTPLGLSAAQTWAGVLANRDALGPMPGLEQPSPDGKGGYQAPDLPADFAPTLTREARYLRWVILDALRPFGDRLPYPAGRVGIVLGTTLHGMRSGGQFLRTGDPAHLRRFLAASVIRDAIAGLPIAGDAVTTCSACSSSLGSVALAATLLETHQLDLVLAGGYDAVSEYAYAGFNALRLVTDGPPRPFARDRRGMKLGEGYAVLALERAGRPGVTPVALLAGYGESADAHHLTQPHPQGRGAAAALTAALSRADLSPADIDLITAHATATPDNDAGEATALAAVFGDRLPDTPVVALKSHLGHTLGAAGAVELILSALALRDATVPPTAHTARSDVDFPGLTVATGDPRSSPIRRTLNTSLGFGGANTAVVLAKAHGPAVGLPRRPQQDVLITGAAVLLSPADADLLPLLNARRVRRLSGYVRLTLAATALALRDAGFTDEHPIPNHTAVLLGSAHGGIAYAVDYYRGVVDGGYAAANPMLFAEGVPNAAAAHVSLAHGLTGACQTIIGSRTSGLDALRLAALRVANGDWDRAVVGAAEEQSDRVDAAYRHAGHPVTTAAGSVALILESRRSVEARGGRVRGVVRGTAAATGPSAIRTVLATLGDGVPVVNGNGRGAHRFAVDPLAAVVAALSTEGSRSVVATGHDGTAAGVTVRPA
jgi:3-oxoacyl-[acyl-carrier-protein] synthase II